MPEASDLNKSITESIKSGEYFKDARDWYAVKYIHPITQRSFLILITVLSFVMAIISLRVFLLYLPLVEVVPIAVDVRSKVEQYSSLAYIGQKEEDPNESLIKYLVMHYIKSREAYSYESLLNKDRLKYLKDTSSREIFDKYLMENSINNPESPVLRYRDRIQRTVYPKYVEVLGVDYSKPLNSRIKSGTYKVSSKFETFEFGDTENKTDDWLATLEIYYETVEYSRELEKFSPLRFKVNHYEVKRLNEN